MEKNNQKIEILCGNLVQEFDDLKGQGRFIEANQLLVQVYYYELMRTIKVKDVKRNVIVAYDFEYDPIIGYLLKKDNVENVFL